MTGVGGAAILVRSMPGVARTASLPRASRKQHSRRYRIKVAVPDEADLARVLGVRFRDPKRLTEALTHRSYLHDHPGTAGEANERLEFLGDAILQFVVAEMLCTRFPLAPEGELTALRALLVSTAALADVAERLGLDRFIRASGGEGSLAGRGRPRILAGTVEAIIAAVHLDGGIRTARAVVMRLLRPRLDAAANDLHTANVKGRLQEHVQAESGETPRYVIVSRDGPVHAERFRVEVRATDRVLGEGEGTGKRAAEHAAARDALARLIPAGPPSPVRVVSARPRSRARTPMSTMSTTHVLEAMPAPADGDVASDVRAACVPAPHVTAIVPLDEPTLEVPLFPRSDGGLGGIRLHSAPALESVTCGSDATPAPDDAGGIGRDGG